MTAEHWIRHLDLRPHPEGGCFKEVYRSGERIARAALPERYSGDRVFGTSIYYLLKSGQVSRRHRLQSDEIWHHYEGSAVEVTVYDAAGKPEIHRLGKDPARGEAPQLVVPHGRWFEARLADTDPAAYVLIGCTVCPGFEFEDFEI